MIKDLIESGIDDESRPFWNGLKEEQLMIQQCDDCNNYIFYPRSICPQCFSDSISWLEAKGTGKIYSYTIVHQAYGPFKNETPYIVGIVELDEGIRMMTRIIGDRNNIAIDCRVSVIFDKSENNFPLPYFEIIPS